MEKKNFKQLLKRLRNTNEELTQETVKDICDE